MAESLVAVKMTKKYRAFLDKIAPGAKIINYSVKASGRPCDICGHNPEDRGAKEGYEYTSDEMRLMRVKLPTGTNASQVTIGRKDFTVTGDLVEWNVCKDVAQCKERAAKMMDDDGNPLYDSYLLNAYR